VARLRIGRGLISVRRAEILNPRIQPCAPSAEHLSHLAEYHWVKTMLKKSFDQACAVSKTLDIVGERWTLLIVRELLVSTLRFQEIQTRLPGIAASLLSDRLKTLEEHEIISREFYSEYPPRASYTLTDKGRELGIVIGALGRWGIRHLNAKMSKTVKHLQCDHAIEPSYYCSHCQETVRAPHVVVTQRPAKSALASRNRIGND